VDIPWFILHIIERQMHELLGLHKSLKALSLGPILKYKIICSSDYF